MRKFAPSVNTCKIMFVFVIMVFSYSTYAQQFDVALSKTTITTAPVKYGTPVPFNITIFNQGTDTIMNVEVIDHYGDGLDFQAGLNPTWAQHPIIVNAITTLYAQKIPPGQSRIVTVNLTAQAADSREDWINTAEVVDFTDRFGVSQEAADTDSSGDEDPDNDAGGQVGSPADNVVNGTGTGAVGDGVAATDEDDHDRDTIQIFDLALTKILDPITGYSYGDTLTFITTVYNQGNVPLRQVRIRDIVPEGYVNPVAENVAIGWTNDAANPIFTFDEIEPFSEVTVALRLILSQTQVDGDAWINYAEVISARNSALAPLGSNLDADSRMASNTDGERSVGQGDPDDNNIGNTSVNPGDQDDHDPAEPVIFDLALIKERSTAVASFNYGTPIDYTFTVINQGNVAASNIILRDSLPCGAMFEPALNPGWTYDPGTSIATFVVPQTLQPRASGSTAHRYVGDLVLTVVPCYDDPSTAWTNYMEILEATTNEGVQTTEIDGVFDANMTNDAGGVPLTDTDNALNGTGTIDEDNHDVELLQVYDLALKKMLVTEGPYSEGQDLEFMIRVYNQGNVVIEDLVIEDFVPSGYGYDSATNIPLGWTTSYMTNVGGAPTTFPDTLNVMNDLFLAAGDSVDVSIILTLELEQQNIEDWYNYAHIWVATDTVGNNRFDDADSNPFTTTALQFTVVPGSTEDNNIFSPGKSVTPQVEEDDSDVANVDYFDLALTKTATSIPSAYGESVTFDIVVRNEGVQFAHDITVVDYLPCGLVFASSPGWSVNAVSGNPEYFYTDTLFAGEEVIIPITLTLEECATIDEDSYRNKAEIANALNDDDLPGDDQDSTPDDDPDNDPVGEDDIDDAVIDVFDLSISKTVASAPADFNVGTPVVYNMAVTNEGNVAALNTMITDFIPCGLTFSTVGNTGWTQNIDGDIEYTINTLLTPGMTINVPLTLTISTCVGEPTDLNNVVEITEDSDPAGMPVDDFDSTPENGDPDEDDIDNAALDFFDLSLEKTLLTDPTTLVYGQDLTYEIVVTNEGSIEATSFTVTDYLGCGLGFSANNGWTLDGVTGYVTQTVNTPLLSGQSTTLTLVLSLEQCAVPDASTWNNIAEISAANDPDGPADDEDSDPDNDPTNDPVGEDDIDGAPLEVGDLALSKSHNIPTGPIGVGTPIDYTITVTNQGNVQMTDFIVTDYPPCAMVFSTVGNAGWTVNPTTGYLDYNVASLAIGASIDIPLTLTIGTCDDATESAPYTNIAEVSDTGDNPDDPDSDPDDDSDNDPPTEDDHDMDPLDFYDLSLEKSSTAALPLAYGDVITYTISVTNEGSLTASAVEVTDYIPCGLRFDPILNTGWSIDLVTGYATSTIQSDILPGQTEVITIRLILETCSGGVAGAWNNVAEISGGNDPTGDPGDDEDSDPDDDSTNDPPGEDDIDDDPLDIFDLSLTKVVVNAQAEYDVDDVVTFNIIVTNEGNVPASNFTVIDYESCGLTYSDSSPITWTANTGYRSYIVPSVLNPGESQTLEIRFVVSECIDDPAARSNRAEISDNGSNEDDADSTPDDNPNNDPPNEDDSDETDIVVNSGSTIGDFVFNDADGDGVQDSNESGISGIIVTLYTPTGDIVAIVETDGAGGYEFTEVPAGDYYIGFEAGDEYTASAPDIGSDATDSDITGAFGDNTTDIFSVDGDDDTIDAGFYFCAEIKGVTYYDVNEDDVRQTTENGINGLVVNVYRRVGSAWVFYDSETTHHDYDTPSDDGIWDFCVAPGQYYVEVVMPPIGLVRVRPFVGGANFDSDINGANGPNTTPSFILSAGGAKTDLGAGYYPMATVGNRVWYDENQNGIQEDEEPKAAGVTVQVYDMNHDLVDEVTTDGEGRYTVEYLEKKQYYLKFEAPEGLTFTFADATDDDADSDVNHQMGANTTSPRMFSPGETVLNIDAGLISGVLPLTWGDIFVERRRDAHQLQWTTLQELNVDRFVVERRLENVPEYDEIGRIDAVGNSNQISAYDFVDQDIEVGGIYYYRILQIDNDGQSSYSKVVHTIAVHSSFGQIYPNPTSGKVNIAHDHETENVVQISIINAQGVVVLQEQLVVKMTDLSFDISSLPIGIYEVVIKKDGTTLHSDRLIKI